jgi:hypothetical protein
MMRSKLAAKPMIAALALSGCASWQLNRNTVDLATSSSDLVTNQVLSNLAKFRASAYAIPSQVNIPSGSATTTNSITPTLSIPIGASATTTLANAAATPLFLTNTRTHVLPNTSLGGSAADQWSQNWTLTPLQDPDQLRRLRALYRFGAGQITKAVFACEYPLVQKAPSTGATGSQTVNVYTGGLNSSIRSGDSKTTPTIRYHKYDCPDDKVGTPDPSLLNRPGCIFCDDKSGSEIDSDSDTEDRKVAVLQGELQKDSKVIQLTKPISDVKRYIGQPIIGLCIPASTVITSINTPREIEINNSAKCEMTEKLSVIPAEGPAATMKRGLVINKDLQNGWLWNPAVAPTLPTDATPLGSYAGQQLYLNPGEWSQKAFSDFVLFVLEATLQGSSSGAASGKGTPQKGGPAPLLQQQATPEFMLQ